MHNFDTNFHPLRSIVLKLFDGEYKAKTCKILTQVSVNISWIDIQEVVFFYTAIVTFFKKQNVTLLTVTFLTFVSSSLLCFRARN